VNLDGPESNNPDCQQRKDPVEISPTSLVNNCNHENLSKAKAVVSKAVIDS